MFLCIYIYINMMCKYVFIIGTKLGWKQHKQNWRLLFGLFDAMFADLFSPPFFFHHARRHIWLRLAYLGSDVLSIKMLHIVHMKKTTGWPAFSRVKVAYRSPL